MVVDLVHRGVVAGFDADQQLARDQRPGASLGDDLLEDSGRELAAATAAVREAGQSHRGVFGVHFRHGRDLAGCGRSYLTSPVCTAGAGLIAPCSTHKPQAVC
jgi:hypothetical protein